MSDTRHEKLSHLLSEIMPWSGWDRYATDHSGLLGLIESITLNESVTFAFGSGMKVEVQNVDRAVSAMCNTLDDVLYVYNLVWVGNTVVVVHPAVVSVQGKEVFDVEDFRRFMQYQHATIVLSGQVDRDAHTTYSRMRVATVRLAGIPLGEGGIPDSDDD